MSSTKTHKTESNSAGAKRQSHPREAMVALVVSNWGWSSLERPVFFIGKYGIDGLQMVAVHQAS
jgi:hypothetical protein